MSDDYYEPNFEKRVEARIDRQIKLAEESNRIMERIAVALEPKKVSSGYSVLGVWYENMTQKQQELAPYIIAGDASVAQIREFLNDQSKSH